MQISRLQLWFVAPFTVMILILAACSSSEDDASTGTTSPPPSPTTTTAAASATTGAPATTLTPVTSASTGDAIATYDGSECVYEGPTEFDLNSTVTFTVTNESDTTDMGFSVWSVPEGTTADEILEDGIFTVVGGGPPADPETSRRWDRFPGNEERDCCRRRADSGRTGRYSL